ncbi:hypothetical protein N8E89_09385 [Phyllobacterium sp. A18/5-2]|uniref:hypothetical protein n=1 Tax=Phyllobacterium sp. A18/5-2 TaxID=2978392 RepID=UPI0021C8EC3F|nr:hypothetical protein [Phyllobacterium sp. A18/5-2]UXN62928.1 hypothetical protein N8E89_09385 [Phyllobacterium sp. A18/5-2]
MNEYDKQTEIERLEKDLENYEHTIKQYEAGTYKFEHRDANGTVDLSEAHYKDALRLVPDIKDRLARLRQL